jgi:DNA-binding CsgD family transcriptional regulator
MQSGLPVGVAAFVGRGSERAKVADLVPDARVVTLTGPGGCGKTRLAVEVVGDVASRFSDGACWVDLQGVSEPGLVALAIGGALDVHERPEQALIDMLAEQLRTRHLLVVLDNCEHLVEACAELVGALSLACPRLHVLATSRVPLVVGGEATFEVAGLPVPDPDAVSAGAVAAADAARLFEVRARQVAADFRIGDDNAAAVAEICRRLDGIPLAIELAAARVRVLAPGQIAAALSDRFGLLTGGVRGAPARHRTLGASLDWSYDLLDDVRRLALAEGIVRIGRGGGSRWGESIGEWLLGVLAQIEERHDDARAHLAAGRALSIDPRLPLPLGRSLVGLAVQAKRDWHLDEAWELAHQGLEVLDDYGDRVGAATALETIADLAVALGEPKRSLRLLAASQRFHTDTGLERFPSEGDRFGRAYEAAQAALDDTDATACWHAGGELALADAVAYARRGRGERQRPQIGWASLTPAELDVVRLVAEGHTNAEIGQRLFISVNTVKKHLSHVYAKLDVEGRTDLAAEVARRHL